MDLLTTDGEFGEFDKDTTAMFCDDKEEYLLSGPFEVCKVVDVRSPTEEEQHLLEITGGVFPLTFEV